MMVDLVIFERGAQPVEREGFDEELEDTGAYRLAHELRVVARRDDDVVGARELLAQLVDFVEGAELLEVEVEQHEVDVDAAHRLEHLRPGVDPLQQREGCVVEDHVGI